MNLVLTSSAGKYFKDYGSASDQAMEARWEQCVANAIGTRIIASRHGKVDPERAYTADLLETSDTSCWTGSSTPASRPSAVALSGTELIEAERKVLGMHHAEIGARLTLVPPEVLVDVIRHHRHRAAGRQGPRRDGPPRGDPDPGGARQRGEADKLVYEVNKAACDSPVSRTRIFDLVDVLGDEMARAKEFVSG